MSRALGRRGFWAAIIALAVLAGPLNGFAATPELPDPPRWGVATSLGGLAALGLGGARNSAGFEGALWLGSNARANRPTRAIGLDVGVTNLATYGELQLAFGWAAGHDGEFRAGIAAGPAYDRETGSGRWLGQGTLWVALVPCPIFPYLRLEELGAPDLRVSVGLMAKIVIPVWGHR